MSDRVTLIVTLEAKDADADAVFAATQEVIPSVMKEPHFESIDLYRGSDDPAAIVLVEKWDSREYLLSDAHQKAPHLQSYFQKITPMLTHDAQWTLFSHDRTYAND